MLLFEALTTGSSDLSASYRIVIKDELGDLPKLMYKAFFACLVEGYCVVRMRHEIC